MKPGEEGFWDTFESCPVPSEWQMELYNYIIMGLQPGSFFTAVLSNDLMRAAGSSHVLNDWLDIMALCQWIYHEAPTCAWGDQSNVENWLALTKEQRTKICVEHKLVITGKDLTWRIVNG